MAGTYLHDRQMAVNFCYNSWGKFGIGYPNLSKPNLEPDQFDNTWPFCIPLRLLVYLRMASIDFGTYLVETAPDDAWFPVGIGYHDFSCDYFSLMSQHVIARLKNQSLRVLFYYHEGDNPSRLKVKFDQLCNLHKLPMDCYLFISANSKANDLENFVYFSDHEHFFRYINRNQNFTLASDNPRSWDFTAINRTHKWWRCASMADLHRNQLLTRSLWSYNTNCLIGDRESDNPIEIDSISGLRQAMETFIANGPYFCDGNNHVIHNDHRQVNDDLYTGSYCSIVIETHFDADQSNGTFLTEKTFKPIKFGQPFVLVAPSRSLSVLRNQGYHTFDHIIDNRYDDIEDNTQRWLTVRKTVSDIKHRDMHSWYLQCLPDVLHNQQVFRQRLDRDLDLLLQKLSYQS